MLCCKGTDPIHGDGVNTDPIYGDRGNTVTLGVRISTHEGLTHSNHCQQKASIRQLPLSELIDIRSTGPLFLHGPGTTPMKGNMYISVSISTVVSGQELE